MRGTPAVVISRDLEADGVDSVLADDLRGGELAVEHLHSLGHRRIAHMDKPEWLPYPSRRQGYLSAMGRFGLEPLLLHGDMTEWGGRRAMENYLAGGGPMPTAIFADNDITAIGVMDALSRHGLKVPEDVSVVGYDNTALAESHLIGLTSLDQHARELGRIASGIALARLAGDTGPATARRLEPLLVARRTSAPLQA